MVIGPRRESRFRRLEPIKNKKGQEEKSEMKFEKVIPNGLRRMRFTWRAWSWFAIWRFELEGLMN
jgi:hypothetical protein